MQKPNDPFARIVEEIVGEDRVYKLAAAGRRIGCGTASVWRWVRVGAKNISGDFVKLEALKIGSQYRITESGIRRFLHALNTPTATTTQESAAPAPDANRAREIEAAKARLKAMGV